MLKHTRTRPLRKVETELLKGQFAKSGARERYENMQRMLALYVPYHDPLTVRLVELWEATEEPAVLRVLWLLQMYGYYHPRFRASATPTERLRSIRKRRLATDAFAAIDKEMQEAAARGEHVNSRQAIERACAKGIVPASSLDAARKLVQDIANECHEGDEAEPGVSERRLIVATIDRQAAREVATAVENGSKNVDFAGVIRSVATMPDDPATRRMVDQQDMAVLSDEHLIAGEDYTTAELHDLVECGLEADLRLEAHLAERGLSPPPQTRLREPNSDEMRRKTHWDQQVYALWRSNCYVSESMRHVRIGEGAHILLREREEEERVGIRAPRYQWMRDDEHRRAWCERKEEKRRALGPNADGRSSSPSDCRIR